MKKSSAISKCFGYDDSHILCIAESRKSTSVILLDCCALIQAKKQPICYYKLKVLGLRSKYDKCLTFNSQMIIIFESETDKYKVTVILHNPEIPHKRFCRFFLQKPETSDEGSLVQMIIQPDKTRTFWFATAFTPTVGKCRFELSVYRYVSLSAELNLEVQRSFAFALDIGSGSFKDQLKFHTYTANHRHYLIGTLRRQRFAFVMHRCDIHRVYLGSRLIQTIPSHFGDKLEFEYHNHPFDSTFVARTTHEYQSKAEFRITKLRYLAN